MKFEFFMFDVLPRCSQFDSCRDQLFILSVIDNKQSLRINCYICAFIVKTWCAYKYFEDCSNRINFYSDTILSIQDELKVIRHNVSLARMSVWFHVFVVTFDGIWFFWMIFIRAHIFSKITLNFSNKNAFLVEAKLGLRTVLSLSSGVRSLRRNWAIGQSSLSSGVKTHPFSP